MRDFDGFGVSQLAPQFERWWAVCLVSILFLQTVASLAIVGYYSPFVPDYDGLAYYEFARHLAVNLFELKESVFLLNHANREVVWWPITNGLTIYAVAVFGGIFNKLLIPSVVHSIYLSIFVIYIVRTRGGVYAFILLALLLSNAFIFRLQTTLTSELAVGLWLIVLLLTIRTFRERTLFGFVAVVFVGLVFRAVDIVFVMVASSAGMLAMYILDRNFKQVRRFLKALTLSLILCAGFFWNAIDIAYDYMKAVSFGYTASAWKSLGGVSGPADVIRRYGEFLYLYSFVLCGAALLAAVYAIFGNVRRREIFAIVLLVGAVCLPLLSAQSLNVQVVFWIYCALVFFVVETLYSAKLIEKIQQSNYKYWTLCLIICLFGNYLFFAGKAWTREAQHLSGLKGVSKISSQLAGVISAGRDIKYIASNFRGIGALDLYGLRYQLNGEIQYAGVTDIYTKNLPPSHYLNFSDPLNLYIAAKKNYQFPKHFGINDVIEQTYSLMGELGPARGFRPLNEISDRGKFFQLWYRPGVSVFLEFEAFNDYWATNELLLEIGTPKYCDGQSLSGQLEFDFEFPRVEDVPSFSPPFSVVLKKNSGEIISEAVVSDWGKSTTILDVENVPCGTYRLGFSKIFSTKQDARSLAALYVRHESRLKFIY